MKKELDNLKVKKGKLTLYHAGLPTFPSIYTRDSIVSALLMNDMRFLHDSLVFEISKQGKKKDKYTGEEPGKIIHQWPGDKTRDLSTEYNACDANALFLIGFEKYIKETGDKAFVKKYSSSLKRAVEYILVHIKNGLFIEDPSFCGAKKFVLKNTYWKDDGIIERTHQQPKYPVCYSLAHIQNIAGLRAAAFLLKDKKLRKKADEMKSHLKELFDKQIGFIIAKDKKGKINAISSDSLHALFYLEKNDLTKEMLNVIVKISKFLETDIGYRVLEPKKARLIKSPYHSRTVWSYEQAVIHAGARKFGLKGVMGVAGRIMKVLDTSPELFYIDDSGKKYEKGGCSIQLWTIAAKKYFFEHGY